MNYFTAVPAFFTQAVSIFFPSFSINDSERADENKVSGGARDIYSSNPLRNSYAARSGARNLRNMTNETSSRNVDNSFNYPGTSQPKNPYSNMGPDGADYSGRMGGGQYANNAQFGENQFLMKSVGGE
jgi:hypothetical protein